MKYLRFLMALIFILSAHNVQAYEDCDPCNPCYSSSDDCCDQGFTGYVDALYWHVCSGDMDRDFRDGEKSVTVTMEPDYDWGWRLGGNYHRNGWDFGFRYTSFSSKSSEDFFLNSAYSNLTTVYQFKYRVFDIELGRSCCVCDGLTLKPFIGGKFATLIADTRNLNFTGQKLKMEYEGNGLYLGFGSRWEMCHFDSCGCNVPLALVTRFSTGIMDSDFIQSGDDLDIDGDWLKECLFVPVHEVYLGLEFGFQGLCNTDAFVQLGYEAQYWGWRDYDNDDDINHLGMGGLVLRLGASF